MDHRLLRAERQKAEMVGRTFGSLTVVSHNSRLKGYNCLCVCGNTTRASTYNLKSGRQHSCGCAPRRLKTQDHAPAKNAVFKNYRGSAARRGYAFILTRSEFFELIARPCHYCDSSPSLTSTARRHEEFKYNGIDRVDNNLGYTKENCVPCCDICNRAKGVLPLDAWLRWVARIYKAQKGNLPCDAI